jgi:hypothetical protein
VPLGVLEEGRGLGVGVVVRGVGREADRVDPALRGAVARPETDEPVEPGVHAVEVVAALVRLGLGHVAPPELEPAAGGLRERAAAGARVVLHRRHVVERIELGRGVGGRILLVAGGVAAAAAPCAAGHRSHERDTREPSDQAHVHSPPRNA